MKIYRSHKNFVKLVNYFLIIIFLFVSCCLFLHNLPAQAIDSSDLNIETRYTGNDGWLTSSNARSFLYSQGKIHWVYTGLVEDKLRVLYSHSEDNGKTWSKGELIAPWSDSKNTGQSSPCICVQSDGAIHVFYSEGYSDYVYTFWTFSKDNGRSWSTPYKVSTYVWYPGKDPGNDSVTPSACVDKDDHIHLAVGQGHYVGIVYYFYNGYCWTDGEAAWDSRKEGKYCDARYPSISVDSLGNVHLVFGVDWSFLIGGRLAYFYRKRISGLGWGNVYHFNFPYSYCSASSVLYNDSPLFVQGGIQSAVRSAKWYFKNVSGIWHLGELPHVTSFYYNCYRSVSLTIGDNKEWICYLQEFFSSYKYIHKLISKDEGATWTVNKINIDTDDNYNNFKPICAWYAFNFPSGLENLFFFQKNISTRRGSYQLWVGGKFAEGGANIIKLLHCQPVVFDPYEKDERVTLHYDLEKEANLNLEILNSSKHIVKSIDLGKKGPGSDNYEWWGVIDCPEIGLNDDKGVFLAPDGEYAIRMIARDTENSSVVDTKEVKVQVKTSW